MISPDNKVVVEALKDGAWAQEVASLPQLEVSKGDRVCIYFSIAHKLQEKGKCRILHEVSADDLLKDELSKDKAEQLSITKNELLNLLKDVDGDEPIWAWWDEIVFPIQGASYGRTYNATSYERRKGLTDIERCVCIDCPS